MDMSQYLEIFIEETREHLQSLNQCLLRMEKNPEDTSMLNEIFRVAHTLKGMSGTMGFTRMSRLTHDMEDVLHALRSNEIKLSTQLVDILFKCLDALDGYTLKVAETGTEGEQEHPDLIHTLSEIIKGKDAEQAVISKKTVGVRTTGKKPVSTAQSNGTSFPMLSLNLYDLNIIGKAADLGNNTYQITVRLSKSCVLKSARAFIIFRALEKHSEIIKSEPKVEDIEDEKFDSEFTVVVISKQEEEVFRKELNGIAEIDAVEIVPLQEKRTVLPLSGVSGTHGSNTNQKLEEPDKEKELKESEEVGQKGESAAKKAKTGKTVRVDIDRLDVLLNLVSELIIQKTRLEGLEGIERTPDYVETVEYLERITTNLHDAVMKVRMVPVETVFNRFPRMIRDISRDLGKEVILTMSGEDTELDRTVIDEIGDPLIHLLRNSADHGIEPKDMRKRLGKPETGSIALRAYQDGNTVVIEVEDDGQGIDIEKVRNKAIEKGLISKDAIAGLSKKEIISLLFKPSFSTADKVTDLSGRGVGLDVVKTKIEGLGGMVDVESETGKGSKFFIRLPLTLAIIQALLVMVGAEKYAIQLNSIHKITNIAPEEIKLVQKQEVVLYRNTVVPIIRLDKVLDVPGAEVENKTLTLVIVKRGDRLTGLVVDRIIGQQEIVQKSLGKFLSSLRTITSATILGDGNVALILDVNALT